MDGVGGTTTNSGTGVAESSDKLKKLSYQGEQYVRWNKKTDSKIHHKNIDYSFGMFKLSLVATMVILPIIIFHIYEYAANIGDSERLLSSMELFSLVSEMWNMNNLMRQALITTILWNNTKPLLGKPAADTYLDLSSKLRGRIVPDLLDMKNRRLPAEFGAFYANITGEYRVCDLVTRLGTGLAKCGDNSLSAQDVNFLMFLRSVVALADDAFETWSHVRGRDSAAAELLQSPRLKNFVGMTHNHSIVRDLYYVVASPLSAAMQSLLESTMASQVGSDQQNQRWQYYVILVVPLTLLTAVAFYGLVYRRLAAVVFSFWHTAFLIPMPLIRKNALLDKYFKHLAASAKTKITFF